MQKKSKSFILFASTLFIGMGSLFAQSEVPASGGDASGSGGSSSYTVGQVVYSTTVGSNGSVAQGVQQAYEIYVTSGVEHAFIGLGLNAFPNPTTDYLTLSATNTQGNQLSYQLYDLQGGLIASGTMTSTTERIATGHLPVATYLLNISDANQPIKTFKIIKN